MVRVLVVDDSPFVCRLLTAHLQASPAVQVCGVVMRGTRVLGAVEKLRPDVVTLDQNMPDMDGLAVLDALMHQSPVPVVMISGVSKRSVGLTVRALQMGAVDFILKYDPSESVSAEVLRAEIVGKVQAAANVRVVRSVRAGDGRRSQKKNHYTPPPPPLLPRSPSPLRPHLPGGVVVVGASTGGPLAVRALLAVLPAFYAAAILVVQHMPASFTKVLATQLNQHVPLLVKEAENGDILRPGHVYIAPGDHHLLVRGDGRLMLNKGAKIWGHRPSVDVTMQSVAQVYGGRTQGVVLTGMGEDGAMGLMAIRNKGGRTFAQNEESSVVFGMPSQAIDLGVVGMVGNPVEIGTALSKT